MDVLTKKMLIIKLGAAIIANVLLDVGEVKEMTNYRRLYL